MVQLTKQVQADGSWRLFDVGGNPVGRIWVTAHVDRILRDSELAEAIAAIMAQTGATRRQAARTALTNWNNAGGHAVDFSTLTWSLNDDAGQVSGNRHMYIAGAHLGYLHGTDGPRDQRLQRWVRLAEEAFSAEQLATTTQRNGALDAAIDRFRTDGALN